jgi:bifunctional ADP-heptose synthase (sugar kinase/adenylyltransferase)
MRFFYAMLYTLFTAAGDTKEKEMTTAADATKNQKQIIQCPFCKASITVDELGEHVNACPEIKKEAIERELQLWGDAYNRNYLMQNVVFCPCCGKVSHLGDWDTSSSKK